VQLADECL